MAWCKFIIALVVSSVIAQFSAAHDGHTDSACTIRKDEGDCDDKIRKWYYNQDLQECRVFGYSGCGGNSNRFESEQECQETCLSPKSEETVEILSEEIPESVDSEEILDVCEQPLITGPCRAAMRRWGFDNGECVQFIYGGCSGNENKFVTKEQCENACASEETVETLETEETVETEGTEEIVDDICELPLVTGRCRAYFPSWGYKDGSCVQFVYGGCGGNENRFSSRKECEKVCDDSIPTASGKPAKCTDNYRDVWAEHGSPSCTYKLNFIWAYNHRQDECQNQISLNCGSRNRFSSKEACEDLCRN